MSKERNNNIAITTTNTTIEFVGNLVFSGDTSRPGTAAKVLTQ